jgi:hypothetical protein
MNPKNIFTFPPHRRDIISPRVDKNSPIKPKGTIVIAKSPKSNMQMSYSKDPPLQSVSKMNIVKKRYGRK